MDERDVNPHEDAQTAAGDPAGLHAGSGSDALVAYEVTAPRPDALGQTVLLGLAGARGETTYRMSADEALTVAASLIRGAQVALDCSQAGRKR